MHTDKLLRERLRPTRTRRELWTLWAALRVATDCLDRGEEPPEQAERVVRRFTRVECEAMVAFVLQGGVLYTTSERSEHWCPSRAITPDDTSPEYENARRAYEEDRPCEGLPQCCWPWCRQ